MKRYDGQIAVVAGASSGLGRRLALDVAARGAEVVVALARRAEVLRDVERELTDAAPRSGTRTCDVSDTGAYAAVLREIEEEHGRIDLLVNAAAIEQRAAVESSDIDLYHRTFATNFFGTVAGTLAVLPGMLRRGSGAVLNMSSDSGRAPAAYTAAYSASKAAVSAFTESVAHEVHGRGVHVHVLYPGWVPTPLGQGAVDGGMPEPPKIVRKTEEQVSRAALDGIGGRNFEITVAKAALFAPVARALFPAMYRQTMRKQAGTVRA